MKMQSIHFTAFAVAAMLACVGCSEFLDRDNFSPDNKNVAISAYASIAETRVDAGQFDGEHYPLTWGDGDALAITTLSENSQGTDAASEFTLTDGAGTKEATFEGEVSKTDRTYYAVYPYTAFQKVTGDTFTLSLPAQQTPGANSLIDPSAVIMLSNGVKITDSKLNFSFSHIAAYAKLALKGLEAGQLKSVTFSTDDACIAGTLTCSPDGDIEGGGTAATNSIEVDASAITVGNNGSCEILLALLPATIQEFDVEATYANGQSVIKHARSSSSVSFKSGIVKGLNINMQPIFELSTQQVALTSDGGEFTVTVTANLDYTITLPDWIEEKPETRALRTTEHTFVARTNDSATSRSDVIAFSSGNTTLTVTVTQEGRIEEEDWISKEFYHHSLLMSFIQSNHSGTLYIVEGLDIALGNITDKMEIAALHRGGTYAFPQVSTLVNFYSLNDYMQAVVDGMDPNTIITYTPTSYIAQLIQKAITKTETTYPHPKSGIEFSSSFSGQQLTVDGTLYFKKAGDYRVTVLLLENDIQGKQYNGSSGYIDFTYNQVARMTLSGDILGDAITAESDNVKKQFNYTATVPTSYNRDNLSVLVYVQYVQNQKMTAYTDCYVDNCISGKVGAKVPLGVIGDIDGGNEKVKPGGEIELQ